MLKTQIPSEARQVNPRVYEIIGSSWVWLLLNSIRCYLGMWSQNRQICNIHKKTESGFLCEIFKI